MYDEMGHYTTHELGLSMKTYGAFPDPFGTHTAPDMADYNTADHYYVPTKLPPKINKYVFCLPSLDEPIRYDDQIAIPAFVEDIPSPFLNFYFPKRNFDERYLTHQWLVGISISISGVETDHHTTHIQNSLRLNLVDVTGKTHMLSGIYCVDGQLVSKCFCCGNLSDSCLCSLIMFRDIKDLSKEQNALQESKYAFQMCHDMPRIKGISSVVDYAILFLDINKKNSKENGDSSLYLSSTLCEGSRNDQTTQSGEISYISSVQEISNSCQLTGHQISGEFNVIGFNSVSSQHRGRSGYPISSGLGFAVSATIKNNATETRPSNGQNGEQEFRTYTVSANCGGNRQKKQSASRKPSTKEETNKSSGQTNQFKETEQASSREEMQGKQASFKQKKTRRSIIERRKHIKQWRKERKQQKKILEKFSSIWQQQEETFRQARLQWQNHGISQLIPQINTESNYWRNRRKKRLEIASSTSYDATNGKFFGQCGFNGPGDP